MTDQTTEIVGIPKEDDDCIRIICDANGLDAQLVRQNGFIECEELEIFLVDYPSIKGLQYFRGLRRLEILNAGVHAIECLDACPELEELWLVGNKISKIEGLDSCLQLQVLHLDDNRIQCIENLSALSCLDTLSLCNNKIETMDGLEDVSQLQTLALANNRIRELQSEVLCQLTSLETLNLAGNLISTPLEVTKLLGLLQLRSLTLQDGEYGRNPVCKLLNYTKYIQLQFTHLDSVDGIEQKPSIRGAVRKKFRRHCTFYGLRHVELRNSRLRLLAQAQSFIKNRILEMRNASDQAPERCIEACRSLQSVYHAFETQIGETFHLLHLANDLEAMSAGNINLSNTKQLDMSKDADTGAPSTTGPNTTTTNNNKDAIESEWELFVKRLIDHSFDVDLMLDKFQMSALSILSVETFSSRILQQPLNRARNDILAHAMHDQLSSDIVSQDESSIMSPQAQQSNTSAASKHQPLPPEWFPSLMSGPYATGLRKFFLKSSDSVTDIRVPGAIDPSPPDPKFPFVYMFLVNPPLRGSGEGRRTMTCMHPRHPFLQYCQTAGLPWIERNRPVPCQYSNKIRVSNRILDADEHGIGCAAQHPGACHIGSVVIGKVFLPQDLYLGTTFPSTLTVSPDHVVPLFVVRYKYVPATPDERRGTVSINKPNVTFFTPKGALNDSVSQSDTVCEEAFERLVANVDAVWHAGDVPSVSESPRRRNRTLDTSNAEHICLSGRDLRHTAQVLENTKLMLRGNYQYLKELDLRNNVLVTLDLNVLSCLKHLQTLDVSFNQLQNIVTVRTTRQEDAPEPIFMPNISVLSLACNDLRMATLQPVLQVCTNVRELTLSGNPMCLTEQYRPCVASWLLRARSLRSASANSPISTTAHDETIVVLDGSPLRLCDLPEDFAMVRTREDARHLVSARLSANFSADLSNLSVNHLGSCISTLQPRSEAMQYHQNFQYQSVHELNLERCCLEDSLSPALDLASIPNLITLTLRGNYLTRTDLLFSEQAEPSALKTLDLSENALGLSKNIVGLNGLAHLINLRQLDLSHNQLSSLHLYPLQQLKHLLRLNLSHNKIVGLKPLEPLRVLTQLILCHNRIGGEDRSASPADGGFSRELRDIRFIAGLPALSVADLRGNPVCTHNDYRWYTVYHVSSLVTLDGDTVTAADRAQAKELYHGVITTDVLRFKHGYSFSQMKGMDSVDLSKLTPPVRVIKAVHRDLFQRLQFLNLSHNIISDATSFTLLPNLQVLILNHNKITSIPLSSNPGAAPDEVLGHLGACFPSLRVLELAYNCVSSVAALNLQNMNSLVVLNLEGNEITQVDGGLEGLSHLKHLVLRGNKLKRINGHCLSDLYRLRGLHLESNYLRSFQGIVNCLPNLRYLNLSKNRISNMMHLEALAGAAWSDSLQELLLQRNPVCRQTHFRLSVVYKLPRLYRLNSAVITAPERFQAGAIFATDENEQIMNKAMYAEAVEATQAAQTTTTNMIDQFEEDLTPRQVPQYSAAAPSQQAESQLLQQRLANYVVVRAIANRSNNGNQHQQSNIHLYAAGGHTDHSAAAVRSAIHPSANSVAAIVEHSRRERERRGNAPNTLPSAYGQHGQPQGRPVTDTDTASIFRVMPMKIHDPNAIPTVRRAPPPATRASVRRHHTSRGPPLHLPQAHPAPELLITSKPVDVAAASRSHQPSNVFGSLLPRSLRQSNVGPRIIRGGKRSHARPRHQHHLPAATQHWASHPAWSQ